MNDEKNTAETQVEDIAEKKPAKKKIRTIGGMEETKWAGHKMFRCPRCRTTTFVELEAQNHTC